MEEKESVMGDSFGRSDGDGVRGEGRCSLFGGVAVEGCQAWLAVDVEWKREQKSGGKNTERVRREKRKGGE